jgi:signal transduction histidine kinase
VRFKQILFNLLSNAIKFTPECGTITLRAYQKAEGREQKAEGREQKAEGSGQTSGELPSLPTADRLLPTAQFLELRVTDTGIGIKTEDLPRLFSDFTQLEAAATKRHEGTGLGLALTKRLVELHGGRICAASEGEGCGSTFTVRLPFMGPGNRET